MSDKLKTADASSSALLNPALQPAAPPVIVERSREEIDGELVGGRRVRFAQATDPAVMRDGGDAGERADDV